MIAPENLQSECENLNVEYHHKLLFAQLTLKTDSTSNPLLFITITPRPDFAKKSAHQDMAYVIQDKNIASKTQQTLLLPLQMILTN